VSYDTIDGNVIKTLNSPYSINIVNDSIMILVGWIDGDEEYRDKLTDEQYLKIKNMVSALNQEYESLYKRRYPYDYRTCVLKIDNQVRYEHGGCASNPEFTIPNFSPMPKEILLLFRYIVDLSSIRIMKPITTIAHQKGTFNDKRDGKTYKTTKIGEQVWLAENLNYEMKSFFGLFTIGNKCYDNKPANCNKYGRLYNWKTAMKACPEGWHLPSRAEWEVLTKAIGGIEIAGKYLKSTSGWDYYEGKSGNGEDKYDFSALPSGFGKSNGDFGSGGSNGSWWSTTEYSDGHAGLWIVEYMEIANYLPYDKDFWISVRCLQD
jgi:uncharacterized protein (TIGR02145 family)